MRSALTRPYSMIDARRAAAAALFFQWFIVVTGATVRMTGSGLGCPNWPTCTTTRPIPELSFHPMVEFLNRITSTPTLVTALIAAWICWNLRVGPRRDLRVATVLVLLGIAAQAIVGAFVVVLELPPEAVSAHFLISIALLSAATFAWVAAQDERPLRLNRSRAARASVVASIVMLSSLLLVILVGVVTTASGPHTGASGTGQVVDRWGFFDTAVVVHARAAWVFLGMLVVLTLLRRRGQLHAHAMRDLVVALVLVVVQIALGEIQYFQGLPWGIVLAHVVNAALLWIVASRIAIGAVFSRA